MPGPISQLRAAWNQTLVNYASGADLDALAALYGLPRPSYISRTAWRRALEAAALGYRGSPNCTQFFLEGALSDYATTLSVVLDPSRPLRLYSPGAEFTQSLVGRLVRIAGRGLFFVEGPEDVTATVGPNEILTLAPIATAYWDAPDWTSLASPITVEAEFLAFYLKEDQAGAGSDIGDVSGTLTVMVWPDVIEGVAPTFLLPYGSDLGPLNPADYPTVVSGAVEYAPIPGPPPDPRPPGEPKGGIMLENAAANGNPLTPSTGPFPLFLASSTVFSELVLAAANLLPAPIKIQFYRMPEWEY